MEATRITVDEAGERLNRGEQFAFVDTRNPHARAQSDRKLGPRELHRALDDFQIALNERWSYRHANAADFDAAIAALRQEASAGEKAGTYEPAAASQSTIGRRLRIGLLVHGEASLSGHGAAIILCPSKLATVSTGRGSVKHTHVG